MTANILEVITDLVSGEIDGLKDALEAEKAGSGENERLVFVAAVHHAIADFTSSTAKRFNGEEHRTSAFMGHLGSTIGWYNLFSHLSAKAQTTIYWNTQKRKSTKSVPGENVTGADFGVAIATDDGYYNLALLQAKNESASIGHFDINRVPDGYSVKLGEAELKVERARGSNTSKSKFSDDGKAANNRLFDWILKGGDACGERGAGVDHQIVKMAQQAIYPFKEVFKDKRSAEEVSNWMHYVVWRSEESDENKPALISLGDVRKHLSLKIRQVKKPTYNDFVSVSGLRAEFGTVPFSVSGELTEGTVHAESLANFLIRGSAKGAAGWLCVSWDEAAAIVKELSALGVQWSIGESSSGQGSLAYEVSKAKPDDTNSVEMERATMTKVAAAVSKLDVTYGTPKTATLKHGKKL